SGTTGRAPGPWAGAGFRAAAQKKFRTAAQKKGRSRAGPADFSSARGRGVTGRPATEAAVRMAAGAAGPRGGSRAGAAQSAIRTAPAYGRPEILAMRTTSPVRGAWIM